MTHAPTRRPGTAVWRRTDATTARLTTVVVLAAALVLPTCIASPATAAPVEPQSVSAAASASTAPIDLRVDGRTGALYAFGDVTPAFSWVLNGTERQTAYEVRVASTLARLTTTADLWNSGKVASSESAQAVYKGLPLTSRKEVFWQVRTWNQDGVASEWSAPAYFEMGLLSLSDWGAAQWIEHPTRSDTGALPVFAKQFEVNPAKTLAKARLYLSGLGVAVSSLNGQAITDEVLAPGGTNEQVSAAYRGYAITDLVKSGSNTLGIELGNGEAFEQRMYNPATGRTDPYSKIVGAGVVPTALSGATAAGATSVVLASVTGLLVGQTLSVDTGDDGVRLEQRRITAIDAATRTVTLQTALSSAHADGVEVTRSGHRDSPNTRVTPRLIARIELTYTDGTTTNIQSDRTWRTATGPTTSDNWWGGSDYDARLEQVGWNLVGSDLSATATRRDGSPTGWINAGTVGTPNLDTDLVERTAEPVKIVDTFQAKRVWEVEGHPGTWMFDMGQAFSGFVQVKTPGSFPAGTNVRMQFGESFETSGANQGLIAVLDMVEGSVGTTGTQTFDSYTTYGNPDGETWHPQFGYDGFQYVQVTGLPAGYTPTTDLISGLQTAATPRSAGSIETDNARINRIHKMSHYSIMSNMQSYFTDCPNREKAGWLADMIQSMPAIDKHFDMRSYLHTMMQAMEDAQTKVGIDAGFVPSTTPNDQVRLSGSGLGNDLNWGGAIVLTPYWLYKNYGDLDTAREHWASMVLYMDYIRTRRTAGTTGSDQYFVNNGLGDWASAVSSDTNRAMTATGAYFKMANQMSELAKALGDNAKSDEYAALAVNVRSTYNERFWNPSLRRYTISPTSSTGGQTAQGIALDYGIVRDEDRQDVLDALVAMIYAYHPNGGGAHLNSGMIGLGPVTRALMNSGREEVLWDLLQEDTAPSYGFFLQDTAKHPGGLTTIPEYWDLRQSQNHMILLQIDEWFTAGLAGIRQADSSIGYRDLVIRPQIVGDLGHVKGTYVTPYGEARSEWNREGTGPVTLSVTVPANSTAEVWAPTGGTKAYVQGGAAEFVRIDGKYAVYKVGPGSFTFDAEVAPAVTTQPAPSTSVEAGTQIELTAAASGVPAPAAQWQVSKDGGSTWADVAGATSGTLGLTVTENAQYRAVFTSQAGSITTDVADVTVKVKPAAPVVSSQPPATLTVTEGDSVVLVAAATGAPEPTVQWEVQKKGTKAWTAINGATSATLTFPAQLINSGASYRATFTNSEGKVTTNVTVVKVTKATKAK